MSEPGDDLIHLMTRKLPTFARLSALGHLDLEFVRIHQIISGYSKTCRSHLLHSAAPQIAIRIRAEAFFIFPAFPGIRLATNAIHRDGKRLVGFLADRSERHGARCESVDDLLRGLDFLDRNR